MMRRRRYDESNTRKIIGWSIVVAIVIAIWYFVLPPQFGGRTILLTTHGTSMEPLLHDGDLAILRKHPHYKVGEVVEYRSTAINAPLLHRIVAVDPVTHRYTTKGDNNDFLDLDQPTDKQINGEMVKYFKGWGKRTWIFKSVPVRVLGATLVGLAVYFMLVRNKDDRVPARSSTRRSSRGSPFRTATETSTTSTTTTTKHTESEPGHSTGTHANDAETLPGQSGISSRRHLTLEAGLNSARNLFHSGRPLLIGSALLTIGSLILAIVGYSYPTATKGGGFQIYELNGVMNYSADATGGDLVYRNGQVQTGDTIYLSMVQNLFVTFNGTLSSPGTFRSGANETIELDAIVRGSTGWSHPWVLTPAQPFSGNQPRVTANIDLNQIKSLVQSITALTRSSDSGGYSLQIQPVVHYTGSLGGQTLDTYFTPSATFVATGGMLRAPPVGITNSLGPSALNGGNHAAQLSGLNTTSSGELAIPPGIPQTLTAFGKYIGVLTLRSLATTGLIIGAIGVALSFIQREITRRRLLQYSSLSAMERNRDMFVSVAGWGQVSSGAMLIDLPSLDDLVKLAEAHNSIVLHEKTQSGRDVFVVNHGHLTYRYEDDPTKQANRRFGVDAVASDLETDDAL